MKQMRQRASIGALIIGNLLAIGPRHRRRRRATAKRRASPRRRSTAPTSTCSAATRRDAVRDAGRQLHAAAGRLRRPELLRARPGRALRNPHRQQRRRQRGPDVPVPLRDTGKDAVHVGGKLVAMPLSSTVARSPASTRPAQRAGDLHGQHGPRRSPHRHAAAVTNADGGGTTSSSRSTTSATSRSPTTPPTPATHVYESTSPAAPRRRACSSASARTRSSSTSAKRST